MKHRKRKQEVTQPFFFIECSKSFCNNDTKQAVWHVYLPTEWKLDTHKSTSKGVIEGVCSTGDEWKKPSQSFQMWITFIICTQTAGHNNHVTAFTLWKRIFLFTVLRDDKTEATAFLIHGLCIVHAHSRAWFLSWMVNLCSLCCFTSVLVFSRICAAVNVK